MKASYRFRGWIQWVDTTPVEIYLQDFEGLDSLATVDSKETEPCLGLIEYSPGQRFLVKEYGLNHCRT